MTRTEALTGSAIFLVAAPGTVAGFIPWFITNWRAGEGATATFTVMGAVLIAIGATGLIESFVRFALKAHGTPAPLAPTQHLVVSGLYRFVRNPMYVAVLLLVIGQMLVFANAALVAYAIVVWTAFHVFVVYFEEPRLRREFGDEYAAYSGAVPRWLPRLTPWRGP